MSPFDTASLDKVRDKQSKSPIDKKTLEHLAELSRIELDPHEEEGLLKDLGNILNHFEELKTLDTAKVPPLAGGSLARNAFREDGERENTLRGAGTESFPEKLQGYLRIPPVFEE